MKSVRFPLVAPAGILSVVSAVSAADTTYPILLTRPTKVGDAYSVQRIVQASNAMNMTMTGQPPQAQSDSLAGELACRCDVTEVDAAGNEVSLFLTIQKFTTGADKKDAIAPGTIIEIKRTEKDPTITIRGGGQLPADAKQVLNLIYPGLHNQNGNDDDAYGTKTPRKVGESWAGNPEIAAKQASDDSVQIEAKNLTATTLLKAAETVGGIPSLRLVTTIVVKDAKPAGLPPGVTVDTSEVKGEIGMLLPVDLKLPPLEGSQNMDIHMVCVGPAQSGMKMVIDSHVYEKSTYTAIKK